MSSVGLTRKVEKWSTGLINSGMLPYAACHSIWIREIVWKFGGNESNKFRPFVIFAYLLIIWNGKWGYTTRTSVSISDHQIDTSYFWSFNFSQTLTKFRRPRFLVWNNESNELTTIDTNFTCSSLSTLQVNQIVEQCKYYNELKPYWTATDLRQPGAYQIQNKDIIFLVLFFDICNMIYSLKTSVMGTVFINGSILAFKLWWYLGFI